MSGKSKSKLSVALLGAGCASLSLAARSNEFDSHHFTVIEPQTRSEKDHTWGFWYMPWLAHVTTKTQKKWNNWHIISTDQIVELSSQQHPYCALSRHEWLDHCQKQALDSGALIAADLDQLTVQQILDSRPPTAPTDAMLQHFLGYEVTTDYDAFNPSSAILMDFRCDQSYGMHFIYYLPFTARRALIESTIFSPKLAPQSFYDKAIRKYLIKNLGCENYIVQRSERGVIPMATLEKHDPKLTGIGANGGAIRPSSGYAFSFIQKQIGQILSNARPGQLLKVSTPHSQFELFMDSIFLHVIRHWPALAPKMFINMAQNLTGSEFAMFLSGSASMRIWIKVVFAMPKLPFLKALLLKKMCQTHGS